MSPSPDQGSAGSVARPANPSTTDDSKSPNRDPGMSSRPGDVTGQPTDTQKPVDTQKPADTREPASSQPKDR